MATEDYSYYLHIMLSSLFRFNPDYKVTVYLINFNSDKKKVFETEFPNAEFREYTGEFNLKTNNNPSNEKQVVTYLKGKFLKEVNKENDKVIWIDATALIRGKLDEIYNSLDENKAALVRRNNSNNKFTFAAEIIGLSDTDIIKQYAENCESLKSDWYVDQSSLNFIPEKDIYNLRFGKYCNFGYQKQALTWSDRGRKGKGNLTFDDDRFTKKVFLDEMDKIINRYRTKHTNFIKRLQNADSGIKVMVFTDESFWCYSHTVKSITNQLNDKFAFTIISNATAERPKIKDWVGDFVWCRCATSRSKKLFLVRSDLRKISFSSITIGGELLHKRVSDNLKSAKAEAGVIVQNEEARDLLIYNNYDPAKIISLPNGVDTVKFPFINLKDRPKEFTIGFAGRTKRLTDDDWKGYSKYVLPAAEILKLPIETANNSNNLYPHDQMTKFFKKISILVLPSLSEGCSNTILEAQSSGIPVITTRTGWHFENCTDYDNIIFCSRNLIDIKNKILELKENTDLYNKISRNARDFAERHSWQNMATHYEQELKRMKDIVDAI